MTKLPQMIAMAAIAFAFGAIALFISLPVHHAEAASMNFTSNTTITSDQTIGHSDERTVNPGVTLTIASGVTVTNSGGTINNNRVINNTGIINNNSSITIHNV